MWFVVYCGLCFFFLSWGRILLGWVWCFSGLGCGGWWVVGVCVWCFVWCVIFFVVSWFFVCFCVEL